MDHEAHEITNWFANVASAGAILMTFVGAVPAIAAIVAGLWYGIQIVESDTVVRWRRLGRLRKIARLQARLLILRTTCKELEDQSDNHSD